MTGDERAVSPVIGVILMVAVTLLLASVFAAGLTTFGTGLEEKERQFRQTVETVSGNPWSGDRGDLFRISNTEAGATDVAYRVNFTIQAGSSTVGNSLNSVYMEVTTGSPDLFSSTSQSDLIRVGVDTNSDGTIDQDITSDVNGWTVQNGGSALKIEFSGSAYTASAGDSIIVVFDGAQNPPTAGTYDMRAQTSGDGNWHYGQIEITTG